MKLMQKQEVGLTYSTVLNAVTFGLIILFAVVSFFLTQHAFNAPVNPDAGYYLSTAKRIAEGEVPFKDIALLYPPISMYILSVPFLVSKSPEYEVFYSINLLFIVFTSAGVYLISNFLLKNSILSLLGAVITYTLMLWCEGYCIVLEPYVTCFYTFGIYFFLLGVNKDKAWLLLVSGAFIFLSFFSKQYALVVLPPIFLYTLLLNCSIKSKARINILLFIGFCISAGVIIAWYSIHGLTFNKILTSLSGSGSNMKDYGDRSISSLFNVAKTYIRLGEYFLFLLPVILFVKPKLLSNKNFWLLFSLNVCAFMPLYFAGFYHYFQLIVPFSTLLAVYLLNGFIPAHINKTDNDLALWKSRMLAPVERAGYRFNIDNIIIASIIVASLIYTGYQGLEYSKNFEITYFNGSKQEQSQIASALQNVVPAENEVLVAGAEEMYFLNSYYPVKPKTYGYAFHGSFEPEFLIDNMISSGQYLVIHEYYLEPYKPFLHKLTSMGYSAPFHVYKR